MLCYIDYFTSNFRYNCVSDFLNIKINEQSNYPIVYIIYY